MRRALFAVALTAALAQPAHLGLLAPFWSLLSTLWGAPATPDAGCEWDPWGRCAQAPQPQIDAGCELDPWGRCHSGS
jgi:hypothetical protein